MISYNLKLEFVQDIVLLSGGILEVIVILHGNIKEWTINMCLLNLEESEYKY